MRGFVTFTTFAMLAWCLASPGRAIQDAELRRRDAVLRRLAPAVREELQRREPDEYTLHPMGARRSLAADEAEAVLERRNHGKHHHKHHMGHTSGNGTAPPPTSVVLAAAKPKPKYAARAMVEKCRAGIATTYDDGPERHHKDLVDMFVAKGQKLTFFLNGNNYGCIYDEANVERIRYSFSKGMLLGSHTWSHPHMTQGLTEKQVREQIELVETAFFKILGVVPRYFRFPYGEHNETLVKFLTEEYDLLPVQWDIDSRDADGATQEAALSVYQPLQPGQAHLILNHETVNSSVEFVAPRVLDLASQRHIQFRTVQECLEETGAPAYKVVGKPSQRDATWTCVGTPS